jgi:hypothetical protein
MSKAPPAGERKKTIDITCVKPASTQDPVVPVAPTPVAEVNKVVSKPALFKQALLKKKEEPKKQEELKKQEEPKKVWPKPSPIQEEQTQQELEMDEVEEMMDKDDEDEMHLITIDSRYVQQLEEENYTMNRYIQDCETVKVNMYIEIMQLRAALEEIAGKATTETDGVVVV